MSRPKMKKPTVLTVVEPLQLSTEALTEGVKAWQAQLEAEIERRRLEIAVGTMAVLAHAIVDTPKLDSIVVRGSTPAWNDGEACVHHQDEAYLNGFDSYGCAQSTFDLEGKAREWTPDEEKAFAAVSSIVQGLEDILRGMFDTNWAILVKRLDDGTVGWQKVCYDCGY